MADLANLAATLFQTLTISCLSKLAGKGVLIGSLCLSIWLGGWPCLCLGDIFCNDSIWFLIPNIDTHTFRAFNLAPNVALLSLVCDGRHQQLPFVIFCPKGLTSPHSKNSKTVKQFVTQAWPPCSSSTGVRVTSGDPPRVCILNPPTRSTSHIVRNPGWNSRGWVIKLMVTTITNSLFLDLGLYCPVVFLLFPQHLKHFQPISFWF